MFQQSTPPVKNRAKPPKAEKESSGWGKYAGWAIILLGILGIAWMIAHNPKQKQLVCKNTARAANSLTAMGSCSEE